MKRPIDWLPTVLLLCLLCGGGSARGEAASDVLSRDALFGLEEKADNTSRDAVGSAASGAQPAWSGYLQSELARTTAAPAHWSTARLRLELDRAGAFSPSFKWKLGGRFDYDAAYDRSSYYDSAVRRDQRASFVLRENYVDYSAGDWDLRLGRQHVVWGEMVGLFFADVVSARDLREFILPDFDVLRIPQWAARVEYFSADSHAELLWIPAPSIDDVGKPGADFYPTPLPGPGGTVIRGEAKPARKLANSNYGLRLSTLQAGWDVSAFYYHSIDVSATYYRDVLPGPAPVFVYQPRHDAIDQIGATLAKDLGWTVLKGEAVYTDGRKSNVTRLSQDTGLVAQPSLDYALGLDFELPAQTRLNLQLIQRIVGNYDRDTLQDRVESAASILLEGKLAPGLEAHLLLIASLNRDDWLLRPRLSWNLARNWRLACGVDVFHGPPTGLFGRYAQRDRVYAELRYAF